MTTATIAALVEGMEAAVGHAFRPGVPERRYRRANAKLALCDAYRVAADVMTRTDPQRRRAEWLAAAAEARAAAWAALAEGRVVEAMEARRRSLVSRRAALGRVG